MDWDYLRVPGKAQRHSNGNGRKRETDYCDHRSDNNRWEDFLNDLNTKESDDETESNVKKAGSSETTER